MFQVFFGFLGKRKPRTVKPKGVTPPTRTPILRNCKTNNQDASGDAEVVKVKKAPVRKQANKSKKENDANAKSKKMLEEDLALSGKYNYMNNNMVNFKLAI